MALGRFPGALVLGLLASLIAHAALFQGDHAMGGPYAGALSEIALAGCAGLLAFLGALACLGSKNAADGSIVTHRLRAYLPSLPATIATAGCWYLFGESLEPAHAALPALVAVLALALAAWIVSLLARALIAFLVEVAFAIDRSPFASRTPVWARRAVVVPLVRQTPLRRRRFARPPPISSLRTRR